MSGSMDLRLWRSGSSTLKFQLIEVIGAIEDISQLAPLHNGPSLSAIRAAREALGPAIPRVAIFDTAFYGALPERASRYAIPSELAERHHIRRILKRQ
jgi:acetate kinase